jgi:serine/threonine protein phosphatase PrpC
VPLRIVETASVTDVGQQRQTNEDAYFERSPVFAVADGMGGARAGEVASAMAVEALGELGETGPGAEQRLREVARSANRRIYEMAQSDSEHAGMGTTFTAAEVVGNEIAVGHVGDSRLYRLRDGQLERLTDDHSLVEELVRQGKLTPQEAETHPQRSIITRALGPEPDVDVETFTFPARDGDVYLICSDGLSGMVSEAELAQILAQAGSLDEAAQRLIDAANQNGGKDNITVVLFRVAGAGEDEEADTLGDRPTQVGVSADAVREAVAEREAEEGEAAQAAEAAEAAEAAGTGEAGTVALGRAEAERARADALHAREGPAAATDRPPERRRPVRVLPPLRRGEGRRGRRVPGGGGALALIAAAALVVGLYAGSRQLYFIGTDDRGAVSLFRGVPYDLPLGIDLYTHEYSTSVPAAAIADARVRKRLLDHHLRSKDDAEGRLRELERTETPR